jgi:hypothetical protein
MTLDVACNQRLGILVYRYPAFPVILLPAVLALTLSYSEHLGPAYGTHALSGRPAVLHDDASGILHFSLGTTLHAVCLHLFTSLFILYTRISHPLLECQ